MANSQETGNKDQSYGKSVSPTDKSPPCTPCGEPLAYNDTHGAPASASEKTSTVTTQIS
jgi:hypothetical protein